MIAIALGLVAVLHQALPAASPIQPQPATTTARGEGSYVPQRVFDTRRRVFTDFETMLADLARADVVFVGEQHDDPNTHRLELAILQGLARRRVQVVVALEMFERDVQPAIDQYASGSLTEEQFLAASRPWPRYGTDYRLLIEFARAHQSPIVASGVPRRIASDVSKNGAGALDALGADRRLAARDLQCPTHGDYYDRFVQQMAGHPGAAGDAGTAGDAAAAAARTNERFYLAQCLKDETMAESIAMAFERSAGRPVTVVHFNGAFHSDFGEGAAEGTRRRLPGRRVTVVSMLPVEDIDAMRPNDDDVRLGDYLILTVKGNP